MYHGEKSNMLNVFKDPLPSAISTLKSRSVVIDFSAIIQSTSAVTKAMTFREFSEDVIKCLKNISFGCFRLDIVCDSYFELSLKGQTRRTRGYGHFLAISSDTLLPKNFQNDFLKNDENKKRLNSFLAEKVIDNDFDDMLVVISANNDILLNVRSQEVLKLDDLRNACRHEEADVKIIPYVLNCADNGYQEVLIKTVDTDVIVLLLAHIPFASNPRLKTEVDFGFGNARTFYDVTKIASNIPPEKRLGFLFSLLLLEVITHRPFTVFQKVLGGTYGFLVILRIMFSKN